MANTVRTAPSPVAGGARGGAELARHLAEVPWEFDLFQAMRLVEAAYPGGSRIGEARRPVDEPVRFAQEASLAFAPSAVAAFEPATAKAAPRLVQRVFGLLGPNGALPTHLTDWARDRCAMRPSFSCATPLPPTCSPVGPVTATCVPTQVD